MNDLVIDLDRRAFELEHLVHHVDGHVHAGAKAAGVGEDDFHVGKFNPTSFLQPGDKLMPHHGFSLQT
jgi:hypothetical protein